MTEKHYRYIDREKSWLAFNARVLQEAGDETVSIARPASFPWDFLK